MYLEAKPPKLRNAVVSLALWKAGGLLGDVLDLVEDNAGGLVDAEQADSGTQHGDCDHELIICPGK